MYAVFSIWLELVLYIDYFMFNGFYLSIRVFRVPLDLQKGT